MCVTFCLRFFNASRLSTGSDKDAIVAVLGARSNKQRHEIAAKYQQKYSKVKLILKVLDFQRVSRMVAGFDRQPKTV